MATKHAFAPAYPAGTIVHALYNSETGQHDRVMHIGSAMTTKAVFDWLQLQRELIEKETKRATVITSIYVAKP